MANKRLIRSTTVLCVRREGKVVMAGDGQVTLGEGVIKHSARKIRRLYQDDSRRVCRFHRRRILAVRAF